METAREFAGEPDRFFGAFKSWSNIYRIMILKTDHLDGLSFFVDRRNDPAKA